MARSLYLVDAFTDTPFAGNPAGVCPLTGPWPADVAMIAREMNQAETAFCRPRPDGDWDLRWFTPAVEVDLCGHATLASAHVLWDTARVAEGRIRFHTRSGVLTASRVRDGIELDFPLTPVAPAAAPPGLLEALCISNPKFVGRTKFDYVVEVADAAALKAVAPAFNDLALVPARGVVVTACGEGTEYDFVSRFFGPAVGIPEDPVTGSAHSGLADYWSKKLSASEMVGYQMSARGGVVRVRVAGDRVVLGGSAVTILSGELRV